MRPSIARKCPSLRVAPPCRTCARHTHASLPLTNGQGTLVVSTAHDMTVLTLSRDSLLGSVAIEHHPLFLSVIINHRMMVTLTHPLFPLRDQDSMDSGLARVSTGPRLVLPRSWLVGRFLLLSLLLPSPSQWGVRVLSPMSPFCVSSLLNSQRNYDLCVPKRPPHLGKILTGISQLTPVNTLHNNLICSNKSS